MELSARALYPVILKAKLECSIHCSNTGKVWTARIAPATPEQQVAWHTMHVIMDTFGIISKARSDPGLFGVKTEELMGQSVAFCIDYFRAMIESGGSMVDGVKNFLAEARTSRQQVWRVGVCPKGRRTIPGLMKVRTLQTFFGLSYLIEPAGMTCVMMTSDMSKANVCECHAAVQTKP